MNFENPAVRNGVLGGMAGVILALMFYIVNPRMFFSVAGWLVIVVYIIFVVKAAREEKKHVDHFSFKDAFKTSLVCYSIASLVYIIFHFVLMNYIDPDLIEIQKEISIEAMEKMSGLLGEEGTEAAIDEIQSQDLSFTPGKALWAFAVGILFPGSVIVAIISAIMKDPKKPEYA